MVDRTGTTWADCLSPGFAGVLASLACYFGASFMTVVVLGAKLTPNGLMVGSVVAGCLQVVVSVSMMASRNEKTLGQVFMLALRPSRAHLRIARRYVWVVGLVLLASSCLSAALGHLYSPSQNVLESYANPLSWLVMIALSPLSEELLVRGFAYDGFAKWGEWTALVGSTVVGCLLHLNPLKMLVVLPLQLLLGFLRKTTADLALPIAVHVGYNIVVALIGLVWAAVAVAP